MTINSFHWLNLQFMLGQPRTYFNFHFFHLKTLLSKPPIYRAIKSLFANTKCHINPLFHWKFQSTAAQIIQSCNYSQVLDVNTHRLKSVEPSSLTSGKFLTDMLQLQSSRYCRQTVVIFICFILTACAQNRLIYITIQAQVMSIFFTDFKIIVNSLFN